MFNINKKECTEEGAWYIEAGCLHDDTKPTGNYSTGSLCMESDTGDVYAYDSEGAEWNKVAALGGGS